MVCRIYKMDDKQYIRLWRNYKLGNVPTKQTKEEVEVFTKDFQGVKDIPPKDYADIAVYIGLN
jgi:hypothetical protein